MKSWKIIIEWSVVGVLFAATLGLAQVPALINYQGRVAVDGTNFNGTGQFQFALVDGAGEMVFWSNGAPMDVAVDKGLYSVVLGDTSLANMAALPPEVFTNSDVRLRVWFDDGVNGAQLLTPDQRLTSAGYALMAHSIRAGAVGQAQLADDAVTRNKIVDGTVDTADLAENAVTSGKIDDGAILAGDVDSASFSTMFWKADGNAGTTPGTHFLGTTDNQALELRVNNQRALRVDPDGDSPRWAAGFAGNVASATGAVVAGGGCPAIGFGKGPNQGLANFSMIGGGSSNVIQTGAGSGSIGGGEGNRIQANAQYAVIAGGRQNTIQSNAIHGAIAGGRLNTIQTNANSGAIGGGYNNTIEACAEYSAIAGGCHNMIESNAEYSAIAGGKANAIFNHSDFSFIGGGSTNIIFGVWSFIGGGETNAIGSSFSVIGGGTRNEIQGHANGSIIVGGFGNIIEDGSGCSVIGGGGGNTIHAGSCVIAGGSQNQIQTNAGSCVIAGGSQNQIQTNADYSFIAGGEHNTIREEAHHCFLAGRYAKSSLPGSFVWADAQDRDFGATTSNQVSFRCMGGVRFASGTVAGNQQVAWVPGDAAWRFTSDREMKEGFEAVDGAAVLEKVAALPLSWWVYKGYDVRHIGPMAQDFHAAFNLGRDSKGLDGADLDGVALAAIQGLHQENRALENENEALKARVTELERKMDLVLKQLKL